MKILAIRFGLGVAVVGFIALSVYQHAINRQLTVANAERLSAITSAAGRLTNALELIVADKSIDSEKASAEIRAALVPLSLAVVAGDVDVPSLNTDSFAGLCALIANADLYFPPNQGNDIDQQANLFVNRRLHTLQPSVAIESLARSARLGDSHKCDL